MTSHPTLLTGTPPAAVAALSAVEPSVEPAVAPVSPSAAAGGVSRDLVVGALLDTVAERRAVAWAAEADVLELVVDYALLHPEIFPGAPDCDGVSVVGPDGFVHWGAEDSVALETLAAALNLSYATGYRLVADAVELLIRLPRLWHLVRTGRVPVWQARAVAALTGDLLPAAVGFVDRQVALVAARGRVPGRGALNALVHEALCQHQPQTAAAREQVRLSHRDVGLDPTWSTDSTRLTATLDTLDALDLDSTLTDLAAQMHRLGDTSPLGDRRAHALGLLAHPQRVLDLFGDPHSHRPTLTTGGLTGAAVGTGAGGALSGAVTGGTTTSVGASGVTGVVGGWNRSHAVLYLHLNATDLPSQPPAPAPDSATGCGLGHVEGFGVRSLTLLREWLGRVERVSVRPVLDPSTATRTSTPPA